jgi:predicted  nucleic acid-binding Zn-ribbon protein
MELCRIYEMKKQKSEGVQALVRETQEIEERTKKLRMRVTELQEEKVALSTQWEKEKAALRQSIKEAER